MKKLTIILTACLPLLCCAEARAQDARQDEVRELEAMLAQVDAALDALEPVVEPEVSLAIYDVGHLLYRPQDRRAPSLSVPAYSSGFRSGGGAGGTGGALSFDDAEEVEGWGMISDPDFLVELVENAVGVDLWDDPCSLAVYQGRLIVRQTARGHARVRALLDQLLARADRCVQLEVGFYALTQPMEDALEEAALGADGVLDPRTLARLDEAVASGLGRLERSAVLTALSEQQVYLHCGGEQSIVSDFELSSGGTGMQTETVADPLVETLRTGLALEMRALVVDEGDDVRVLLEAHLDRAKSVSLEQRQTPWGAIDVPRLSTDSVRTSAEIPPGSGMLIYSSRGEGPEGVTIVVRPRLVEAE